MHNTKDNVPPCYEMCQRLLQNVIVLIEPKREDPKERNRRNKKKAKVKGRYNRVYSECKRFDVQDAFYNLPVVVAIRFVLDCIVFCAHWKDERDGAGCRAHSLHT
jgi:hypothetical protein